MKERDGDNSHQPKFENLCDSTRIAIVEALKSGANRRDILGWMGAAGIGLAAGQGVLAAATSAIAQTPKKGGALRVAMHTGGTAETLDPAKQAVSIDYPRARTFFSALTKIAASGEAESELAESFEHSADGREWVFRLRSGVEFHDGKTLTSQDVVYTLMRHKEPATASVAKTLMEPVESVVADGPNIVRVKLAAPNADMPLILGTTSFVIVKDGTRDFSKPIGTGPFKLDGQFVPGSRTIGKKFANYFKTGRPYLDEVHIFFIPDSNARANALFSGDVDAATNLSPSALEQISNRSNLALLSTKSGAFTEFAMMCDRKPTDNSDFRLAVKYLLDRDRYLKTVQRRYGQLGNDHPVPPNHPLYNHHLPQRSLDLDKAEFYLRKSGLKGTTVELSVSDGVPGTVEMGQIFQQSAARAGLTVDLRREPSDGYYSNVWMKKPFSGVRWQPRPSIDILLSLGWLSDAKWNDTAFRDPTFDKLVIEARGELDQAKRRSLYGEIQRRLYEDGGSAIFSFIDFKDALSAKVKGIEPNSVSELGGYYFPDTAWFDS